MHKKLCKMRGNERESARRLVHAIFSLDPGRQASEAGLQSEEPVSHDGTEAVPMKKRERITQLSYPEQPPLGVVR